MHKYKVNQLIFLVLIPLFMFFIAFIFDFSSMIIQNIRVKHTTETIIKDALTYSVSDYYKNVKDSYEKHKISTELLEVEYDKNENLTIYNSHSYTSFFGKLIGINHYRAEVHLSGHKEGDKIIIKEVRDE